MTVEQLAKQIFDECAKDGEPVSIEESKEMAEMEIKAKGIKNYVQTVPEKPKAKKEIKLDDEKVRILETFYNCIKDSDIQTPTIANPQREITFVYNGSDYSLVLTKHRPPKK